MQLKLVEETSDCLAEHGRVPAAFEVREQFEIVPIEGGLGGLAFRARAVAPTYTKDYDRLPGNARADWARRWDLSQWWFAAGFVDELRVAGAAVVMDPRDVEGVEAPADTALLWDVRVDPRFRRRGVGRRLLEFVEAHVRSRALRRIKVETQNVNVAACSLYAAAGYTLAAIDRLAYPTLPEEVRLIWYKDVV